MASDARFQFIEAFSQIRMLDQYLAQTDEGAHDEDTHFDGPRAVQHTRHHNCTVFGKNTRQVRGKFESLEVVTFCDDLLLFFLGQHKGKINREALGIALHSLI